MPCRVSPICATFGFGSEHFTFWSYCVRTALRALNFRSFCPYWMTIISSGLLCDWVYNIFSFHHIICIMYVTYFLILYFSVRIFVFSPRGCQVVVDVHPISYQWNVTCVSLDSVMCKCKIFEKSVLTPVNTSLSGLNSIVITWRSIGLSR